MLPPRRAVTFFMPVGCKVLFYRYFVCPCDVVAVGCYNIESFNQAFYGQCVAVAAINKSAIGRVQGYGTGSLSADNPVAVDLNTGLVAAYFADGCLVTFPDDVCGVALVSCNAFRLKSVSRYHKITYSILYCRLCPLD